MLNNLKKLFSDKDNASAQEMDPKLAFSALLLEAGMMDGNLDDNEKLVINNLISNSFELSSDETEELINEAINLQNDSSQLISFVTTKSTYCATCLMYYFGILNNCILILIVFSSLLILSPIIYVLIIHSGLLNTNRATL